MTDPWARPTVQASAVPPPQGQPGMPAQGPPPGHPPEKDSSLLVKVKNLFRDPVSIILVVVIVVALVAAGLLIGEIYARSRANKVVAQVVSCVVRDEATASFDAFPPFLLQHMSGHYRNIDIETAGNQIREAKGMKVELDIDNVRLQDTTDSAGTVGSLDARITWSAEGIKETIQDAIPLVGSFVTGVSTDPSAGTIELEGALGSITARPEVVNDGIALEVTRLTGLGFTLPREAVQPALDAFTDQLTADYPMGIHADSVQVTDSGVVSQFSTRNAAIPKAQDDPCFQGL